MKFSVIVTLGPAVLNHKRLKMIDSYGHCIYRINGAHVNNELASNMVQQVRDIIPSAEIVVDLPGNKIRTTNLSNPISVVEKDVFEIFYYQINYPGFLKHLKKGDIIHANDSTLIMEVVEVNDASVKILPHSDGVLSNNKGLLVKGIHKNIPFLFDRDYDLICSAREIGVDYISLSFVRTADDIKMVRKIISEKAASPVQIIAKIETAAAVENLESVLEEINIINIDRGDLSSETGIQDLACTQERIIETALRTEKEVFLATQFLKNMEINPIPLIPEAIDLYTTIRKGISGVQLSEETAIGKYPVECVKFVFDSHRKTLLNPND